MRTERIASLAFLLLVSAPFGILAQRPSVEILRPNSSDRLQPGSNFRIVWRTQGVSGGTDWNLYFATNGVELGRILPGAVNDGEGNWHADVTVPDAVAFNVEPVTLTPLPSSCNYTLHLHDDVSEVDDISEVFCLGVPVASLRVSQVEFCWTSRSNRTYQVQYRSALTTNLWTNFGGPVPGNGTTNCVTEPVLPGEPQRYYRVEELP